MFTPSIISILNDVTIQPGRHKNAKVIDNHIVGCRIDLYHSQFQNHEWHMVNLHLPLGGVISMENDAFNAILPYLNVCGREIITPMQITFQPHYETIIRDIIPIGYPAKPPLLLLCGYRYVTAYDPSPLIYYGNFYIAVLASHGDDARSYNRIVYPQQPFHIFAKEDITDLNDIVALRKVSPISGRRCGVTDYIASQDIKSLLNTSLVDHVQFIGDGGSSCIRGIYRKLYGTTNAIIGVSPTPLNSSNYPVDLPVKYIDWRLSPHNVLNFDVVCGGSSYSIVQGKYDG